MTPGMLTAFIVSTAVIVAVPGPNILLLVNHSVQSGFRRSLATILGIKAGMLVLFTLSMAGFAALMETFTLLFTILKWTGAAYLVFLGVSQLKNPGVPENGVPAAAAPAVRERLFLRGFLISVSNPKGLLFAGAFFPQFLNREQPLLSQVIFLVLLHLAVATVIELLYAGAADRAGRLFRTPRFSLWVRRLSGTALILFGAGLAFLRSKD